MRIGLDSSPTLRLVYLRCTKKESKIIRKEPANA